jgi:FtsP/CotA-like multicopper oxidase with cupredoxin domain
MSDQRDGRKWTRRQFLRAGLGAAALAGTGTLTGLSWLVRPRSALAVTSVVTKQLAASDGFIWLPGINAVNVDGLGTEIPGWDGYGDQSYGLFSFGFKDETGKTFTKAVSEAKGKIQVSAPIIAVNEDSELRLNLANVAFQWRPDLADGHTVHWHGFRNAIPLFDGVPEVSIAVPHGRTFPYVYRPHDAGTYIYHCHFEDVEHVQQGMQSIVYVRPKQNGTSLGGFTKFAYNDGDGSTGYKREYSLLLNDVMAEPHIRNLHLQEFIWTDYKANYWTINGRSYPDTIKPMGSLFPTLPAKHPLRDAQPISSLIQVNGGDRVLLRFANLGYEQQSMELVGIKMRVVGEDATLLRGPGGANLAYDTNTIYVGPGESRDALFTAPAFKVTGAETDSAILPSNPFNRYLLKNRNYQKLNNNGQQTNGLGGQATEVRVYRDPLPAQGLDDLNKTY